jgi:ABC-type polar amino acid transport system ATPase subunit
MATQQIHQRSLREIESETSSLQANNISLHHGKQTTLEGVSIIIKPGELTALIGPSGAGKTTLLKVLSCLEQPQTGTLTIDNKIIQFPQTIKKTTLAPWPTVTTVFQQLFLWPHLTLRQNISLPMGKKINPEQKEYLEHLITRFQMSGFLDRYPNQASLGQRQRTALVRALVLKPKYLLLDEITSSLDVEQIALILKEINGLKEQGIGILLITHLLQFAQQAADSVVFMERGEVVESGSREVLIKPKSNRVKAFLELAKFAS